MTVRIFVFKDVAAAEAWWKTKYEQPGWEELYEAIADLGDVAVRVKELPKAAVRKGNVRLSAHQLHDGDEYRRALEHYLKCVSPEPQAADAN